MTEEFVAPTIPALFDRIGPTLRSPTVLADPSAAMLRGFLSWGAADPEAVPTARLLAREGTLKSTLRSFPTASLAADLVEADRLQIRYTDEIPTSSVLVGPDRLYVLLEGETRAGALSTTDVDLVADVGAACRERFERAERF
ncbi:MAG: transcriptional regulator TbsP domain-containing protein, partial [Halobacteriota archaeon]